MVEKPQPKQLRKGIRVFPPFMSKKSKLTILEIWSVILDRPFSVQGDDQDRGY
jgi:hypothetical protein